MSYIYTCFTLAMGNKQSSLDFVTCIQEIQTRSWLAMTPPSFPARDKVVLDGKDIVRRLCAIYKSFAFIPMSKEYVPPKIPSMEVLCEADWDMQWGALKHLMDVLETCSPSNEEMVRAKPHLENCIKRFGRAVKRYR